MDVKVCARNSKMTVYGSLSRFGGTKKAKTKPNNNIKSKTKTKRK